MKKLNRVFKVNSKRRKYEEIFYSFLFSDVKMKNLKIVGIKN